MADLTPEDVRRLAALRQNRRLVDEELAANVEPPLMPSGPSQVELAAMGGMTPEEQQALSDMQAAQRQASDVENLLPILRAGQMINQAWTGAAVDQPGLQMIGQLARRPEAEAAMRLKAAQDFARRRMEGAQAAQRLGITERELAQRQQMAEQNAAIQMAELAQRAKAQQAEIELRRQMEARRAAQKPKAEDELTRRKKELEVAKLEAELEAAKSGKPMGAADEMKRLQLEEMKQKMTGEVTPAEMKKRRELIVEVNERGSNIDRNLEELEELVKKGGTYNAIGPHNRKMQDKIYQVAIDIAKLMDPTSVAREGEVNAIMKFALFEPTPFMRDDTALELIRNLRRGMSERVKEAYRVRGLSDVAEKQPAGLSAEEMKPGAMLSPEKQKLLNDYLDRAMEDRAKAKGAK